MARFIVRVRMTCEYSVEGVDKNAALLNLESELPVDMTGGYDLIEIAEEETEEIDNGG